MSQPVAGGGWVHKPASQPGQETSAGSTVHPPPPQSWRVQQAVSSQVQPGVLLANPVGPHTWGPVAGAPSSARLSS